MTVKKMMTMTVRYSRHDLNKSVIQCLFTYIYAHNKSGGKLVIIVYTVFSCVGHFYWLQQDVISMTYDMYTQSSQNYNTGSVWKDMYWGVALHQCE